MRPENRIDTAHLGSVTMITLHGEHDLSTSAELRTVVETVARPGARVVFDLSPATFIDSTILQSVIYAAENADGLAIVAPPDAPCRRVLELTRIADIVRTCASQDEALRSVLATRVETPGAPTG